MEEFLTPAITVAIIGLILQGVKAGLDLVDRSISRKFVMRQSNIALFLALMQLTEAAGLTPGEVIEVKEILVKHLLADTLSPETLGILGLRDA